MCSYAKVWFYTTTYFNFNGTEINNEYDDNSYLHSSRHNNANGGNVIEKIYDFSPIAGVLQNRNSKVIQGGYWFQ